jgi:hypothetical protein
MYILIYCSSRAVCLIRFTQYDLAAFSPAKVDGFPHGKTRKLPIHQTLIYLLGRFLLFLDTFWNRPKQKYKLDYLTSCCRTLSSGPIVKFKTEVVVILKLLGVCGGTAGVL